MGQVTVVVNGQGYDLSCKDGEEEHVRALGRSIDRLVMQFVTRFGQVGDARLLIMTCLMLADELADTRAALERAAEPATAHPTGDVADELQVLAERIENVAARLEHT